MYEAKWWFKQSVLLPSLTLSAWISDRVREIQENASPEVPQLIIAICYIAYCKLFEFCVIRDCCNSRPINLRNWQLFIICSRSKRCRIESIKLQIKIFQPTRVLN